MAVTYKYNTDSAYIVDPGITIPMQNEISIEKKIFQNNGKVYLKGSGEFHATIPGSPILPGSVLPQRSFLIGFSRIG